MFKVLMIACIILPYPRGEMLKSKCFYIEDKWQPSAYGYLSKKQCQKRVSTITKTIRKNFALLELKNYSCKKIGELS